MAAWFDWEDPPSPDVGEFLAGLRQHAAAWLDADPLDSHVYEFPDQFIVVGLDVCDRERRNVLRTLRVDYGPLGITYGEDATCQFVTALGPAQAEYGFLHGSHTAASELAAEAARWLRAQMVRPIELVEWLLGDYELRKYRLADSGRNLSWSATENTLRSDLGTPTRVSRVVTLAGPRGAGAPAA